MGITTGGSGNDTLQGSSINDTLRGYAGNDTYVYLLGEGADVVVDTGGTDTLSFDDPDNLYAGLDVYRNGANLVFDFLGKGRLAVQSQFSGTATPPASAIEYLVTPGDGPYKIANGLAGTAGADFIVGTANADTIAGGAGDDWIFGGAGNDVIYGGVGRNQLSGGAGDDKLIGGNDGNELNGGAGNDTLQGGTGWDDANYESQTRGIFVNMSGGERTYATKSFAAGQVYETATASTDTLVSIESIRCSNFNDTVVLGQPGANVNVTLGKGNDIVMGGITGTGPDSGWASVGYWDDPAGVIVNLSGAAIAPTVGGQAYTVAAGKARDGWGTIDTFQLAGANVAINGSRFADYIRGRDDSNTDSIWESFSGAAGNDTIDGGSGNDSANYNYTGDGANAGVRVNLSGARANLGGFVIEAGTARDNWGDIDTLRSIENVYGSSMNDHVLGSAADNDFDGAQGNDTLDGGVGNDNLRGGDGSDVLIGGAGADRLYGGNGSDRFVFKAPADLAGGAAGFDFIGDFTRGQDKIDLSSFDADALAVGQQHFSFVTSFTTAPGQARFENGWVYLNTDNDATAEYQLQVNVIGGSPLSSSDFSF